MYGRVGVSNSSFENRALCFTYISLFKISLSQTKQRVQNFGVGVTRFEIFLLTKFRLKFERQLDTRHYALKTCGRPN